MVFKKKQEDKSKKTKIHKKKKIMNWDQKIKDHLIMNMFSLIL